MILSEGPELQNLVHKIPPITPDITVDYVGELLLSVSEYQKLLSLPIVEEGKPVGTISRYQLMNIFLNRYGRELHGNKPIHELMNREPIIVEQSLPMETAAQLITNNMSFPVTEDFIITDKNRYLGTGMVLDLLRMMESKISRRTNELARAYKTLKESQAQLIQSEKMASLGQMVAGVAHEINTPLGYIKSNVEIMRTTYNESRLMIDELKAQNKTLLNKQDNNDKQVLASPADNVGDDAFEQIELIIDDTLYGLEQISEMVLNLKDFSRLDKAMTEDVSLNDCIDSTLNIGRHAFKYAAQIKKDYGDIPSITCSPSQINQVLLNIITNAAQSIEESGVILIKSYHDEDYVYISIQDTGRGIPQNILPKIFDPFFTTKPVGQGSGMGLSISYKIIQQHKGKIKVSSQEGKGTRFILQLPVRQTSDLTAQPSHTKESEHGNESYDLAS